MNKEKFKDKIILITGGVQGIGLRCAERFSSLGSKVIVTCKSNTSYESFKNSCSKAAMLAQASDRTS